MKFFRKAKKRNTAFNFNSEKLFLAASQSKEQVYSFLNSRREGLYSAEAVSRLKEFGSNEIIVENNNKWFILLIKAFINPFIGILIFLALISIVLDVILADPNEREWVTVIIITTMVTLSDLLRFYQEWKAIKRVKP